LSALRRYFLARPTEIDRDSQVIGDKYYVEARKRAETHTCAHAA
jgi:hypothetical protein